MLASQTKTSLPARYHHVSVMSECDAECSLCATLGCLRPSKISAGELQSELNLAHRRLKTSVVFPPNILQHPEAAQFVSEVVGQDLGAIVRLRPEQLIKFSDLIATLAYRGAGFELIVSRPLSEKILSTHKMRTTPNFKTVFIPTREFDPLVLFDSLPFSWRRSVEVLSCLVANLDTSLSPDELFLTMKALGPRARPYVELDRHINNMHPSTRLTDPLKFEFVANGSDQTMIELSLVYWVDHKDPLFVATLDVLKIQSLSISKFEICFSFDGVNDEKIEQLSDWARSSGLNIRGFYLANDGPEPRSRKSQCWNLAATHARGSCLVFLQSDTLLKSDESLKVGFLERCVTELSSQPLVKIIDARVATPSVALTLKHYFDLAGFAEAVQEPGCEIDFLIWKSEQIGVSAHESIFNKGDQESTKVGLTRKSARAKSLSAREFYACTLSADVFKSYYEFLGNNRLLRRLIGVVARTSVMAMTKAFLKISLSKRRMT